MTEIVSIRAILSSDTAGLRATSDTIFDKIRLLNSDAASRDVQLDFSGIEFISRSFAHSLVSSIASISPRLDVTFTNMADEVAKMFQAVREQKSNQSWTKRRADLLPSWIESEEPRDFFEDDRRG